MSATTDPTSPSGAAPTSPSAAVGDPSVAVPATTHARRAWLLLGLGVFQLWLWSTRLVNLLNDPEPRSAGFIAVHAVLYVAAFGTAFVLLGLGWRQRREAATATDDGARPADRSLTGST